MEDKVKIVDRQGVVITLEQWQKRYGLKISSTQIGKYFSYTESRFRNDIRLYGEVYVNEPLIRVLDQWREDLNESVNLNAFNRDQKHQDELTTQGFRTATFSPHVVIKEKGIYRHGGFAADKDTSSHEQTNREVLVLAQSAKKVGIKIRYGYKDYQKPTKLAPQGQTFIHVDVGPEYYAPGKPWNKFSHPVQWEKELVW
jgi:hypothetical protein